jgi:hypothetical protein
MRRRAGRKRKSGRRYASGDLRLAVVSARQVAAGMPHRGGSQDPLKRPAEGEISHLAENNLGRLFLAHHITADQLIAGQEYARRWAAYQVTLEGPTRLKNSSGKGGCCENGCVPGDDCWCERRVKEFNELSDLLIRQGHWVELAVQRLVLFDGEPESDLIPLIIGLNIIARHLGLTKRL